MEEEGLRFRESASPDAGRQADLALQASLDKLRAGGIATQVFAMFVRPQLPPATQLEKVLRYIDLFYTNICLPGEIRCVRTATDLRAVRQAGEIAALLSVEGAACVRGQTSLVRILHHLGVRGMGLTWNPANDLADGCGEPRGGGLTEAGIRVVQEMARLQMWVDLAHLSDAGVQDVFRYCDGPIMASHANARAIYPHPRNLTDEVIVEIVRRNGWIGLTFEGSFLNDPSVVQIDDVFRHLDHMLSLGAERCVGFGSDFDGLFHTVPGLADAADYRAFAELVVARYGESLGRAVLFENFERFLLNTLP
ncbi:MAG: dipeptidase [Alicyclobacillus sp.]|nr:dipeptidase [Alicyclobacillus sp.]